MYRILFSAALAFAAVSVSPAVAGWVQDGVAESGDTQRRGQAEAVRAAIRNDPLAPQVAPRGYDMTVVFFSDYQCGYCRRFSPLLDTLMESDPKVRVVYRDLPILGGGSEPAARAAIAAKFQGRHLAFHRALLAKPGPVNDAKIRAAALEAKLDFAKLQRDQKLRKAEIDALLGRNRGYAQALGLRGTPALLIGDTLVPGAIDLPTLRKIIADQRAKGNRG